MLAESVGGLLPLQPGVRVLGAVAVGVGESAQAAYKAQREIPVSIGTAAHMGNVQKSK